MSEERLLKLEENQLAQKAQVVSILASIQSLIQSLYSQSQQTSPPPPHPNVISTSPTLNAAKPNPPPLFDGNRSQGESFLNAVRLYIDLRPLEFISEQSKIDWVLSYMTGSDSILRWRNRIQRYRRETRLASPPYEYYLDWDTFEAAFTKKFCHRNVEIEAIQKLEGVTYFQQDNQTVERYVEGFEDLIDEAGYIRQSIPTVIKFRRGLNSHISSLLPPWVQISQALMIWKGGFANL